CVSPDGRFVAFLRDGRAWTGRRGTAPLREADVRALGGVGAHTLAFGADSDRLFVARGAEVEAFDAESGRPLARFDLTVRTAPPPVLRRAGVVDAERGVVNPDQRIESAGERIARVVAESAAGPLPPGATELDASGRFVAPGLTDMHVHGPGAFLAALAAYGVT